MDMSRQSKLVGGKLNFEVEHLDKRACGGKGNLWYFVLRDGTNEGIF